MLARRQRHDVVGFLVKLVGGHGEGILQAMRYHERAGVVNIPLFHDQFDDGIRGHRIETARGRIVEQKLRLRNQGACDGHAAPHASGKLRRRKIKRVFQFHKAQGLANLTSILSS